MKAWIIILSGLIASWHYSDLHSVSALNNLGAPFLFLLFLIALLSKLVIVLGLKNGRKLRGGDDDDGGLDGFGGDGDGFG